ncbi:MAG: UvrD-helicase domain-containing protein [Rhodospirillales bacterium]|nr:UvrD-helicase domain-containing protein [Rhodospirillales bacterium]MBO6788409.1 UvrD-helicase domain-containing protein [Rhodospirillales bacterium]
MSDPFELDDEPRAVPAAPRQAPGYLDGLNDSQRAAVEAVEGPVLVLAGAGTGKTRVLTTRLAHILMQNRAGPGEILAVTFTNKAAGEMKERVSHLVGRPVEGWWVGTFHAIGARILRANAEAVGLSPQFTILDADDQVRLIKQLIDVHDINEKRLPPRAISGIIQRWKDRGFLPDKVPTSEAGQGDGKVLDLYKDYQERLATLNAADFGDLLLLCLKLFQEQPDVLKSYQSRFRYIMVDEYQDTNVAQYLWLRLLAQGHRNICCVGDDDQSIYSWRGAEVGNILRFEEDFPGARVVRLERNYRSTPHILAAASGLITHNEGRLGKTLWTDINGGEKVRVRGVWDGEAEARLVGDEIEAYQNKGEKLNDMAVLVRAGFQTREFEERLITLGIPYRVIGGPRFYERQEIRDAIAYLRVIAQPDDDLAFERIVNVPTRGIGKSTLQIIHTYARAERISLTRAITKLLETDELRPQAKKSLGDLLSMFDMWRVQASAQPPAELCKQVLEDSGYTDMWRAKREPDAPGRLDNLKELVVALEDFEMLGSFLEHVSLVMENEERSDTAKVSIMTLHGAKGLEFATVFLPGWEEGLFPNQRSLDEGGLASLEEERRLAYVGITRARKHAMISFAANRRVYGQWQSATPSRFIDELPAEHIDVFSESGVYARQDAASKQIEDPFAGVDGIPRSRRRMVEVDRGASYKPTSDGSGFDIGVRVFHQKFGYGKITSVDGDKLDIDFEKAGQKRVMASFVLPA